MVRMLVVAQCIPRKNIDAVLRALLKLAPQCDASSSRSSPSPRRQLVWELAVAGNSSLQPQYTENLKRLAAELEAALPVASDAPPGTAVGPVGCRVEWLGELREHRSMLEALRGASIFVNASLFENYCMAACEAVCVGLPIISTDVGEVRQFSPAVSTVFVPAQPASSVDAALAQALQPLLLPGAGEQRDSDAPFRQLHERTCHALAHALRLSDRRHAAPGAGAQTTGSRKEEAFNSETAMALQFQNELRIACKTLSRF